MATKKFRIQGCDIKQLIKPIGSCMASDKITVDGEPVGFMYRETSDLDHDSGWRFLSGTETQQYADNLKNWAFYDVNTIVNYDVSIINYLSLPIGTELERIKGTNEFRTVNK
jgi:hypothetical protein